MDRERDRRLLQPMLDSLHRDDAAEDVHRIRIRGQSLEGGFGRCGQRARAGKLSRQGVELVALGQAAVP